MANVPATAKNPQDRKPKAAKPAVETGVDDGHFWFELEGDRFTFEPVTTETMAPGEFRRNRANPSEITYTLLERTAPPGALEAIDAAWGTHNVVLPAFDDYASEALGASLGESSGSST